MMGWRAGGRSLVGAGAPLGTPSDLSRRAHSRHRSQDGRASRRAVVTSRDFRHNGLLKARGVLLDGRWHKGSESMGASLKSEASLSISG